MHRRAHRARPQVLTILDSTALSWPGLNQAVDDLQFLVDMSSQTTSRLELDHANMETLVKDARSECITLKETLAMQNQSKEDLQRKVLDLEMEIRKLQDANAAAAKESAQQKQVRRVQRAPLCALTVRACLALRHPV